MASLFVLCAFSLQISEWQPKLKETAFMGNKPNHDRKPKHDTKPKDYMKPKQKLGGSLEFQQFEMIDQRDRDIVFGFIREYEKNKYLSNVIPISIYKICALFYFDPEPMKIPLKYHSRMEEEDIINNG